MTIDSTLRTMIAEIVREELARVHAERDDYLDPNEAGRFASVSAATVRRWVREGKLPGAHAGNRCRVRRSDLENLLRSGARSGRESPEQMAERLLRGVP